MTLHALTLHAAAIADLGPAMAYEAQEQYRQDDLECRFISNIDPTDAAMAPSKTFGTLETLTNARLRKPWLLDRLRAGEGDPTVERLMRTEGRVRTERVLTEIPGS